MSFLGFCFLSNHRLLNLPFKSGFTGAMTGPWQTTDRVTGPHCFLLIAELSHLCCCFGSGTRFAWAEAEPVWSRPPNSTSNNQQNSQYSQQSSFCFFIIQQLLHGEYSQYFLIGLQKFKHTYKIHAYYQTKNTTLTYTNLLNPFSKKKKSADRGLFFSLFNYTHVLVRIKINITKISEIQVVEIQY